MVVVSTGGTEEELKRQGLQPFHPTVAIPLESLIRQTDGKFDVNWRKKMWR